MPNLLISYLYVKDIINLYHISKFYRQTILKRFSQIYNISTGFCSADQWHSLIQKFCYYLIEDFCVKNILMKTF